MRSSLPSLFVEEANKDEQGILYHLIELEIPNSTPMYLVDSNIDITYDGQLYSRFPLQFSGTTVSADGSIDKPTITVANAARVIMYYVEQENGLRGCRVTVKTVYEKFLDFKYTYNADGTVTTSANSFADTTAYIEDDYLIDSYIATDKTITFQLEPVIDYDIKLPKRRFTPFSCYWKYKDPDTCAYTAALTGNVDMPTCSKTLAGADGCEAHNNSTRFGGFPGVPANARRIFL